MHFEARRLYFLDLSATTKTYLRGLKGIESSKCAQVSEVQGWRALGKPRSQEGVVLV